MKAGTLIATAGACLVLPLSGCGGGDEPATATQVGSTSVETVTGKVAGKLPPGAEQPDHGEGPAAREASPEAAAEGPATADISAIDEEAATQSVRFYIYALDRHDAALACSLFAPGALRDVKRVAASAAPSHEPVRHDGCADSLAASIGHPPDGGGPAWKRTEIVEIKAAAVEGHGTRVTATVTHHFSDRKYVSVEDDVIYLVPSGDRWLLAKPSATLYRAVGYGEPPLRAFSPPASW